VCKQSVIFKRFIIIDRWKSQECFSLPNAIRNSLRNSWKTFEWTSKNYQYHQRRIFFTVWSQKIQKLDFSATIACSFSMAETKNCHTSAKYHRDWYPSTARMKSNRSNTKVKCRDRQSNQIKSRNSSVLQCLAKCLPFRWSSRRAVSRKNGFLLPETARPWTNGSNLSIRY
jgi:hypothetical protein